MTCVLAASGDRSAMQGPLPGSSLKGARGSAMTQSAAVGGSASGTGAAGGSRGVAGTAHSSSPYVRVIQMEVDESTDSCQLSIARPDEAPWPSAISFSQPNRTRLSACAVAGCGLPMWPAEEFTIQLAYYRVVFLSKTNCCSCALS